MFTAILMLVAFLAGVGLAMFFEPKAKFEISRAEAKARSWEAKYVELETKIRTKIDGLRKTS